MKDTENLDDTNLAMPDSSSNKKPRTFSNVLGIVAMGMLSVMIIGMMSFVLIFPLWLYTSGKLSLIYVGISIISVGLSVYMLREIIYRLKDEWNVVDDTNGNQSV